jgi:ketosteroid isomerase-like protein
VEEIAQRLIEMENEMARAFNQRDLDRILALFDAGQFSGFSSTKYDRIRGLKALRKTFEYYLSEANRVSYSVRRPEVQVFGSTAVVTFYWQVKLSGGLDQTIAGRGTHVYARQGRQWRVVHEHFSKAVRGKGDE